MEGIESWQVKRPSAFSNKLGRSANFHCAGREPGPEKGRNCPRVTQYAKAEVAGHFCLLGLTQLDHFLGH